MINTIHKCIYGIVFAVLPAFFINVNAGAPTKPSSTKISSESGKIGKGPDPMSIPIVYVPGNADCDGIYSDLCGWGGWGGYEGGGVGGYGEPVTGGGGIGGGGASLDDGTRSTNMQENRFSPGCYREYLVMEEDATNAAVGNPLGMLIISNLGDPLYNNGQWVKYQDDRYFEKWSRSNSINTEWRVQTHYLYNKVTHEVAQLKLKNSYQQGCIGRDTVTP